MCTPSTLNASRSSPSFRSSSSLSARLTRCLYLLDSADFALSEASAPPAAPPFQPALLRRDDRPASFFSFSIHSATQVLALAAIAAGPVRQADGPVSPDARMLARLQAAVSMVIPAVGAVSVAALALLGVAVAHAGAPPAAAAGAGVTLKAAKISGVTVLTNTSGLTLYWFAPDTPAFSKCTGSCTAYWPPVTGNPKAGPGVTGKLGTIKRPGGGVQATYDGHPLYTYIGDNGPGQAQGNNLNLNGGLWYEVRVSG